MRFEEEVKQKLKSIEGRFYITFAAAMVCGLWAHLYQFTNKIFNYDELGQTPAGFGAGIGLGRWGLELVGNIVNLFFRTYSLPMINGVLTLILISVSACILVEVFGIRDKVCCFLIGGIISVFPTLVGTFFFMFTAPYYGLAMLLACLSGKYIVKALSGEKLKSFYIVIGFIYLVFSTGIYQAYCAITLSILLIDVVIDFYVGKSDWKKILYKGIGYCTIFVASLGTYIGITRVVVKITGIDLSGYKGMDSMGSINLGALVYSIFKTYKDYIYLMRKDDIYQINPIVITNVVFALLNIILIVVVMERMLKKEAIIYKIGLGLSVILTPIAFFFAEVMTQARGGVYSLTVYSAVFVFILPVVLYDKRGFYEFKVLNMFKIDFIGRVLCISVLVSIYVYIWFANGNYQDMQYTTYHDMAYFETLVTQVKSLDGYSPNLKVALVGDEFDDPTFRAGGLMDEYFNLSGKLSTNINYFNNIYIWSRYLGFTPEIIEFADSGYLSDMDEVKAMPCYPEDGSIAIVGDTVVIKASEKKEN